ncbi:activator of Hsp90 ATPase [Armillaria gallica]|uniref:Activator of Hsp90 ATPase n=1 Tax=Armillaria gallica TaxID=47427 RepID=A0A2H3DY15_ARMGA|nr:activator of Hsp90 ATPase [Armillaria gallica]
MAAPPAPLPSSTANWHWKNKNITKWGQDWFEQELTGLRIETDNDSEAVWISNVFNVAGDIELGQRKSKLITIYDCELALEWEGTTADGTEVKGRLDIPEVSHEITMDGLSQYQFFWSLSTAPTPEINELFEIAKANFPKILEDVFAKFPAAIFETHGKDLTVSTEPSRANTPKPAAATPSSTTPAAPEAAPKPAKKEPKAVNTATVVVDGTFKAAADDLFGLLTDEKRIPIWTRAGAQSAAKPDTEYSLFGGGVKGKYVSLTPPKEIVQTWALSSPTWPSDHTATLTTTLDQSEDSTKVTFTLSGVPLGMEDEIKRNLEGYYIHGFKSIGYVQLIPYVPSYTPKPKPRVVKRLNSNSRSSLVPVVAVTVLILAAAFAIPFFSSS